MLNHLTKYTLSVAPREGLEPSTSALTALRTTSCAIAELCLRTNNTYWSEWLRNIPSTTLLFSYHLVKISTRY